MTEQLLLYLYAESPVHAGAAEGNGVIDLAIQREAATGYPVIWGQSLKGALRQAATDAGWDPDEVTTVFGRATVGGQDGGEPTAGGADKTDAGSAGLLAVGDAQVVAFPVPTLQSTFAWVTSELALSRLARKYRTLGRPTGDLPALPTIDGQDGGIGAADWSGSKVLGSYEVRITADDTVTGWAARIAEDAIGDGAEFEVFARKLRTDLLVAGTEVFPELLREGTELSVRVQLTADKTVKHGPFYSEYLPAETILAVSLSLRRRPKDNEDHLEKLRDLLGGGLLQVGGDETLGKGLVWPRLHERVGTAEGVRR